MAEQKESVVFAVCWFQQFAKQPNQRPLGHQQRLSPAVLEEPQAFPVALESECRGSVREPSEPRVTKGHTLALGQCVNIPRLINVLG